MLVSLYIIYLYFGLYYYCSLPLPDCSAAVHLPQSQSNHPEKLTHEDEEKTVKLLRMMQTKEINCKTAQTEQHASNPTAFKHTTPERCSERNYRRSEGQLNLSKEVEMSTSPPLKHKDIEVMSTVHEQFDQKKEIMTSRSSRLLNSFNGRWVKSPEIKSHESLDPLSSFMMLRTSRKSPVQTPRRSSPATAGIVRF